MGAENVIPLFINATFSEEEPTMYLKTVGGVLHQQWRVKTFDGETLKLLDLKNEWRPVREEPMEETFTVEPHGDGSFEVHSSTRGRLGETFATHREAWRAIDRLSGEPVSRSEKTSQWIMEQMGVEK